MCESPDAAGKGLSLGVLIIGSLYWDNANREQWRQERLDPNHKLCVHAPIRYGRQSANRGNSYTMVFSTGLREADFYFCENRKSGIQTFQDEEVEGHLRDLGHVC